MIRVWLLVIPAISPLATLVMMYLVNVVPQMIGHIGRRSHFSYFEWWWWHSERWWNATIRDTEYLVAVTILAFLAGSIIAVLLHLFTPRRFKSTW